MSRPKDRMLSAPQATPDELAAIQALAKKQKLQQTAEAHERARQEKIGHIAGLDPATATISDCKEAAREHAKWCQKRLAEFFLAGLSEEQIREELAHYCHEQGLSAPDTDGDLPAIRRMTCVMWWRRRILRVMVEAIETLATGRLIGKGIGLYASTRGVTFIRRRNQLTQAAIEKSSAINLETGEIVKLDELMACTLSNPELRRHEMMARIHGLEAMARERGQAAQFWTITTPSRFHARIVTGAGSVANPQWDGSTPRNASLYLSGVWARTRAKWHRAGLHITGIRVSEPHHDGTPHWHILAFGEPEELARASAILQEYALQDDGDEPGAAIHRFKSVTIDPARGSAAGYVAVYVAKSIHLAAEEIREGEDGGTLADNLERVKAWASARRIRQFQFFGALAAGVWRALRRAIAEPSAPTLSDAVECAKSGDVAGATQAVQAAGGVRLAREEGTGFLARIGRYGDRMIGHVVGIIAATGEAITVAVSHWEIQWGIA